MKLSVVVPAYQSASTMSACLEGLLRAVEPDDEIVVVDDGSSDGTDRLVATVTDTRVRLIRQESNIGRGPARNLGASHASGDVIVFVDSDVVVHEDSLARIRQEFSKSTTTTALIGSYDDTPGHRGVVSQFRNLLHHHTHQTGTATSSHFWTGLGAVRTDVFRQLTGFSEKRWSRNMEDVEFGHRLSDAGHVILVRPEIQGTHLRPYTLASMIRSDLFDRAIPWTRLTLADRRTDHFVLSRSHLVSALSAGLAALFCLLAFLDRSSLILAALALGGFAYSQRSFWAALTRLRGVRFLAVAAPLSYVHTITALVGFAVGFMEATRDFLLDHLRIPRLHRRRSRTDRQSFSTATVTNSKKSSSEK